MRTQISDMIYSNNKEPVRVFINACIRKEKGRVNDNETERERVSAEK